MPATKETTKHTPGPWQAQDTAGHNTHGQSAVYAETDGKDIAIVYDGEANARLIAAAPDLLAESESVSEQATEIESLIQGLSLPNDLELALTQLYMRNQKLQAAIRKAKG